MTNITDQVITDWKEAAEKAAFWKDREMELRKLIFAGLFPNPVEGSGNKLRIGHGMAMQATYKINRSVNKDMLNEIRASSDNIAPLIAKVINFKPELRVGEWKKLDKEDILLLAPAITEKPGSPELELKPAAKIRW